MCLSTIKPFIVYKAKKKVANRYGVFVRENTLRVRAENPGKTLIDLMARYSLTASNHSIVEHSLPVQLVPFLCRACPVM